MSIVKSNYKDKLYLLCLCHRYIAPRVCCLYRISVAVFSFKLKNQLKPSTWAWWRLICKYVKEHTLNIEWLFFCCNSNRLSYCQYFIHISSLELHKHAGAHIVIRALCQCMQWQAAVLWGWWEGLCSSCNVISRCCGNRSPCWMTCRGGGPQLFTMTWEVTSVGKTEQPLCGSKMLMGAQGQQVHLSCSVLKWSLFEQLRTRTVTHCAVRVYTSAVLLPGFSCILVI